MPTATIYYDYLCPNVYRAAVWLDTLAQAGVDLPRLNWRFFSLNQVNHRLRDGWQIWEQPQKDAGWEEQDAARAIRFFWAAAAAARQGDDAFTRFHRTLLHAIHADGEEVDTWQAVRAVAASANLDMTRFDRDVADPGALARLGADHNSGIEQSVFGTPTFVFDDAPPAYIRLTHALTVQEAQDAWSSFYRIAAEQPYITEIKRPR